MFHRRLLLLLAIVCCATVVLIGQIYKLTVIDGPHHRADAQDALQARSLLPTTRGKIFDVKGRLLAEDRPCFDIAVDYAWITGEWAYNQARRLARRDYIGQWTKMDFEDREEVVAQYRQPFDEQAEKLWRDMTEIAGIDRAELERRKAIINQRVQAIRADVWDRMQKRQAAESSGPVDEIADISSVSLAEEQEPQTLLPAVSDEAAQKFQKLAVEQSGLHVIRSSARVYSNEDFEVKVDRATFPGPLRSNEALVAKVEDPTGSIVGRVGDAQLENVQRRPFHRPGQLPDLGGYLPGDDAGTRGVEKAEEDTLRGLRGELLTRLDTQAIARTSARPGKDVHLTIDVALQARIAALLDPTLGFMVVQPWHAKTETPLGTPLYGCAIVMDVDTSNILAMVSTPTASDPTNPPEGYGHEPTYNKALGAIYAPGSTVKPLVYASAVREGVIKFDERIDCNGYLFPDKPNVFRCWGWRPAEGFYVKHGPQSGSDAIEHSCNIFFYTCGKLLGPDAITTELRRWGLGQRSDIGLPDEVAGQVGLERRELTISDAINMGIGQGPVAVPPIQIAAAHAALVRGGYYLSPILIRERAAKQKSSTLDIPAPALTEALRGMYESANSPEGTANHIIADGQREPTLNIPGLTLRAKTGTAQNTPRLTPDGEVIRKGEHSWYVVHAQKPGTERASYIIVVLVEYGGSGGRTSGPIANQILYALRDEGYL